MATTTPTVFVCGITGTQGGALARQLLALNWTIHSTVRSLDTPAAQKLKADGVKLTLGVVSDGGSELPEPVEHPDARRDRKSVV